METPITHAITFFLPYLISTRRKAVKTRRIAIKMSGFATDGVLECGKVGLLDREREGERAQFHDDKDRGHHKERDVFLYSAGIHDGVSGLDSSLNEYVLII